MVCSSNVQKWTAFGLSCFFLVNGLYLVFFWKNYYDSYVQEQMILTTDSYQYKYWLETPIDLNLEIYLFNWTNSDEFENGAKPHFEQLGPYVYSQKHTRANVFFNSNKTVSFNTVKTWQFLPEKTKGSLDDMITVMNPIILSMAHVARKKHYVIKRSIHYFLKEYEKTIKETKTAREFLFDGVDDIMMDIGLRLKMKDFEIPFDKFGYFYSRNASETYEGNYTMWTGVGDVQKTGIITEWKGNNVSKAYEGQCGRIDGTTGEVWYPTKDSETVSIFVSDVCSLLTMEKQGSRTVKGIPAHVYALTDRIVDNGTKYPEMACFSPNEVLPSGVRDISTCQYKAPAYLSFPHFYLADPSYRDAIDGMNPDPQKHKFEMVFEPTYGLPLEAHISIQVNFRLYQVDEIDMLKNVKDTMVPYLWVRVQIVMPEHFVFLIKIALNGGVIGQWIGYALIFISLILFLFGVYLELKQRNISILGGFQKSMSITE